MPELSPWSDSNSFSKALFEKMIQVNCGLSELELYEFRYALDNITPPGGWSSVELIDKDALKEQIHQKEFFSDIQLKPTLNGHIVLDEKIVQLTRGLFVGLVTDFYPVEWIKSLFYFDIRGFIFFVRTQYYKQAILDHFGSRPYVQLAPSQDRFDWVQEIGYKEFKEANTAIDRAFIDAIKKLITLQGTPLLISLVGPSAAGKTEIVERLQSDLTQAGRLVAIIEMDNFFKDREFRDGRPLNKEVIHLELFKHAMEEIMLGHKISIPRYDFVHGTSSHDLESNLRPGQTPIEIEPADIMFLEGNFPFHIQEIAGFIDIKVVYLTGDPIRLKRKWKRDVDYRKKYNPAYLCNRFFRIQIFRAKEVYQPMMEVSDIVVDTSAATLWVTPKTAKFLNSVLENSKK